MARGEVSRRCKVVAASTTTVDVIELGVSRFIIRPERTVDKSCSSVYLSAEEMDDAFDEVMILSDADGVLLLLLLLSLTLTLGLEDALLVRFLGCLCFKVELLLLLLLLVRLVVDVE